MSAAKEKLLEVRGTHVMLVAPGIPGSGMVNLIGTTTEEESKILCDAALSILEEREKCFQRFEHNRKAALANAFGLYGLPTEEQMEAAIKFARGSNEWMNIKRK